MAGKRPKSRLREELRVEQSCCSLALKRFTSESSGQDAFGTPSIRLGLHENQREKCSVSFSFSCCAASRAPVFAAAGVQS